jgi:hypothetical protein
VTFQTAPTVLLPFDFTRLPLPGELTFYLDRIRVSGGSSPFDALKSSSELLMFAPPQMRRIVLLLVDGPDTHSRLRESQLEDFLKRRIADDNILFLIAGIQSYNEEDVDALESIQTLSNSIGIPYTDLHLADPQHAIEFLKGFLA